MRNLWLAVMLTCIPLQAIAQADTTTPTDAFSVAVNCPKFQICPALIDTLDRLTPLGMRYFAVPGVAIALIQDGKVIHAQGFGVRNIASGAPFTLDTIYRIGSTSKAFTSMLAATQVDRGLLAWDTPVLSLRSDFQLPNKELTDTIQVQQLMNMGSGINDTPFVEYADLDSPQHLWQTVRDLEVFAAPETEFRYNNTIYALGGYVGALAQGVPIPELLDSYKSSVKERIFDPIEMPSTAMTDEPETLSNNIATPYKYDLTQDVFPLHPNTYMPLRAIMPSGGIASTMNDMTRYVITQLQAGVAPNGRRVVSSLNLEKTWKGQIPLGPNAAYALGWVDVNDGGVRLVTHSGSIDGFKTDIAMLPDAGIGIVIFTNSSTGSYFASAVRSWVLHVLYGSPIAGVENAIANYEKQKAFIQSLRASILSLTPECNQIAGFTGGYEKGWVVQYDDNQRLWLTRENYYHVPLVATDNGYLLASAWDSITLSSVRASFVSDPGGTPQMAFFQLNAGSSEQIPLDTVKLIAPEPISCGITP
ncbi:MAG: serine hydrolase domain-containing protein [Acidobacteriaceae bacterium]